MASCALVVHLHLVVWPNFGWVVITHQVMEISEILIAWRYIEIIISVTKLKIS